MSDPTRFGTIVTEVMAYPASAGVVEELRLMVLGRSDRPGFFKLLVLGGLVWGTEGRGKVVSLSEEWLTRTTTLGMGALVIEDSPI